MSKGNRENGTYCKYTAFWVISQFYIFLRSSTCLAIMDSFHKYNANCAVWSTLHIILRKIFAILLVICERNNFLSQNRTCVPVCTNSHRNRSVMIKKAHAPPTTTRIKWMRTHKQTHSLTYFVYIYLYISWALFSAW